MKHLFLSILFCTVFLTQAAYAKKDFFSIFPNVGSANVKGKNELPMEDLTGQYEKKVFKPTEKGRKSLPYFWFQPSPPYPEGIKFPLVLILHGATGNAYAGKFLITPEMQIQYPTFIVVPTLPAGSIWAKTKPIKLADGRTVASNGYEALHDAIALIESLKAQFPIDPKRIFVIGCSEGGVGTFGAAFHYPDVFAAAIPLSGAWNPEDAPKMTKVPLWAFHGGKDTIMPAYLSKDVVTLIHQYGGTTYYTEFPEMGHECPSKQLYSPQMWEWLFKQRK